MAELEITNRAPTWGEVVLLSQCRDPNQQPLAVMQLIVARTNLTPPEIAAMGLGEVAEIFNKVLTEMKAGLNVAKMSMQMRRDGS